MKKNDLMGYLVYALMLGIALGVGLGVIQPMLNTVTTPIHRIAFIVLAVLAGILLNALLLEFGHLLGAKLGKYKVMRFTLLGFSWKRKKDEKFRFTFGEYDGLTGETYVLPKDPKTSKPGFMIHMPLLFLLAEVVALVILIVLSESKNFVGWKPFFVTILAVAAMIFLYDIFPAPLDSKNDGYLLTILTNETNRVAYNEMLLAEDKLKNGEPAQDIPVYEEVTNFTYRLNRISFFARLSEGKYEDAMAINEKTIACEKKVSSSVFNEAIAEKTSLILLTQPLEDGREFFIALPMEAKKYIASLSSTAAVRAYLLVSGLVEDSEIETGNALGKIRSSVKKEGTDIKKIEERVMRDACLKVKERHPDWDFSNVYLLEEGPKPLEAEKTKEEPKE